MHEYDGIFTAAFQPGKHVFYEHIPFDPWDTVFFSATGYTEEGDMQLEHMLLLHTVYIYYYTFYLAKNNY